MLKQQTYTGFDFSVCRVLFLGVHFWVVSCSSPNRPASFLQRGDGPSQKRQEQNQILVPERPLGELFFASDPLLEPLPSLIDLLTLCCICVGLFLTKLVRADV